jgi:enoyl-[acyl-carrier protein] reductase I
MGLLDGKRIVITGVLTDASLAFSVARLAQEEGADLVLTGAGRGLSLTERTARKLPKPVAVHELDVTVPEHLDRVRGPCRPSGTRSTACSTPSASPLRRVSAATS